MDPSVVEIFFPLFLLFAIDLILLVGIIISTAGDHLYSSPFFAPSIFLFPNFLPPIINVSILFSLFLNFHLPNLNQSSYHRCTKPLCVLLSLQLVAPSPLFLISVIYLLLTFSLFPFFYPNF
jgi:hypothetical protein